MNPFYNLVAAVEQDLSRSATALAEGVAQNLQWLSDEKRQPQNGVAVVQLERMQRLGLVGKDGKLTSYGHGIYNQLFTSGYYSKPSAERAFANK